ncbi:MAG: bifunctional phosphoribosylaminoimidazolecarboxamide formyltransferase/IMP cyclohydrolase [Acidobacteria bacterium]|nr:bifunctional phosphoribosylaminoimidazolecarboxamide formyltransferase/IMP cyclohydrolase [Acidobacteriota bacterium]
MPRALLSVSDKTGVVELARGLAQRGFELVSTGGTARALADAGLRVTGVSEVTGFPEMMDGRVKTLHPRIHGGLLARRDRDADLEAARAHGIGLIDVAAVNLYPFAATARQPGVSFDEIVEQIDIGGPSLVRAAAKNFRAVLVAVDPARYPEVLAQLDRPGGPELSFRLALAQAALAHTGQYDVTIASSLAGFAVEGTEIVRRAVGAGPMRPTLEIAVPKLRDLRYGENPHQKAALYGGVDAGFIPWTVLQGKELSYTNLLDLDAALRVVLEFAEPAAAVVKHTNPCGAATGASAADAYLRARDADPLAAFGGIVAVNRPIDVAAAEAIASTFIEAVIAPGIDDAARPVLARKTNMRVVVTDFAAPAGARGDEDLRSTLAGILVQDRDRVVEAREPWTGTARPDLLRVVTRRPPTPAEWRALQFAWRVCAHVKSNTILFAAVDRTLAVGAGQMSRVDAVNVAVLKAGDGALRGSVAASDAFFPFRDGLDAVARAGATAVVQPGGSVRDGEVIAAADEHGLAMVFTGRRHFRH